MVWYAAGMCLGWPALAVKLQPRFCASARVIASTRSSEGCCGSGDDGAAGSWQAAWQSGGKLTPFQRACICIRACVHACMWACAGVGRRADMCARGGVAWRGVAWRGVAWRGVGGKRRGRTCTCAHVRMCMLRTCVCAFVRMCVRASGVRACGRARVQKNQSLLNAKCGRECWQCKIASRKMTRLVDVTRLWMRLFRRCGSADAETHTPVAGFSDSLFFAGSLLGLFQDPFWASADTLHLDRYMCAHASVLMCACRHIHAITNMP